MADRQSHLSQARTWAKRIEAWEIELAGNAALASIAHSLIALTQPDGPPNQARPVPYDAVLGRILEDVQNHPARLQVLEAARVDSHGLVIDEDGLVTLRAEALEQAARALGRVQAMDEYEQRAADHPDPAF